MCNSTQRKLCSEEDCQSCFEKSFASHEKAVYWSEINEISPRNVLKGSGIKYKFNCECGHIFSSALNKISSSNRWCPYCSKPPKQLCNNLDCQSCFEKSFASHEKSKYWSSQNELIPRQIFKGSHDKYLFNCNKCFHQFDASIGHISNNKWCPYCANLKLCENNDCYICFEKSFASHEKSQFWSIKNELKPRQVFKGSHLKYLFDCLCGHTFEIATGSISGNNCWCSYCSNPPQKLCEKEDCQNCFKKSFASHEKSIFWSDKNDIQPRHVFKSTGTKYWFNCNDCHHIFESSLCNISGLNRWCPYCSNPPQKLCENESCQFCFNNSFASHEKSIFWCKNNNILPRQVFKNSNTKFYFFCKCDHSFEAALNNINSGYWCPYCSEPPKKLCDNDDCQKCFEKSFASNDKSKFWSEKNNVNPRHVFKSSGDKYLFDCICGHYFEKPLNAINQYGWCPYCANQKLCENDKCSDCFEKSFASHDKVIFWSVTNELLPRNIFKGSPEKYFFICSCGHFFESSLSNITSNKNWCPYCSEPPKKLCDNEDCQKCFEKSFASIPQSKFFSKNNQILPRQLFKGSPTKFIFDCSCGHSFESRLHCVSKYSWCPYCSIPPRKICEKEDCKICFIKSFASHDKSKFWNEKNELIPRQVLKGTHRKYLFNCNFGHLFNTAINKIVSSNRWCPICVNKTEKKIFDHLSSIYPNTGTQFRTDWCRNPENNYYLPFDFVLEDYKIIIELDGAQHFRQVREWTSPEITQKRDQFKMKKALENGYSVIRLLQEDVYSDKYDWKSKLAEVVKFYDIPEIIFLCQNAEYDVYHISDLPDMIQLDDEISEEQSHSESDSESDSELNSDSEDEIEILLNELE